MRMLQKPSSFVLTSLKASTYATEYASAFRSLRPCWKGFFTILADKPLYDAQSRPIVSPGLWL